MRVDRGVFHRLDMERSRRLLQQVIQAPSSLPGYAVLKYSKAGEVFKAEVDVGGKMSAIVCKGTRDQSLSDRLAGVLRGTRSAVNFAAAVRLVEAGFLTAEPLVMLERRGFTGDCWFITEKIERLTDLDTLATSVWSGMAARELFTSKRSVICALIELLDGFKGHGIWHRDFKASNVTLTFDGESPKVWIVDLDGLSFRGGHDRWRMWVRLAASLVGYRSVTRTDCLRVLLHHMVEGGDWKSEWRRLAERVRSYNESARKRKVGKLDGV